MIYSLIIQLVIIVIVLDTSFCDIYRLPTNIKPVRYVLTIEPNVSFYELEPEIGFSGSVIMEIKILENTQNITFHYEDLHIDQDSIQVLDSHGSELKVVDVFINETKQMYTIQVKHELINEENYFVKIDSFRGILNDAGEGFFLVIYQLDDDNFDDDDEQSKERILAATHFQPSHARKAFPCFDEPALKAKFVVNIIRRKGFISLSNEQLRFTKDLGDGRFMDVFKETPIMPTYTLAFTISQFEFVSSGKFRIFAKPSAIATNKVDYIVDTSVKTLKALENYTGIKHVMDKIDEFIVPDDTLNYYAMENWGLIIWSESVLFYTESFDTDEFYQNNVLYIAHELAHQWFGNLVTPGWWNVIWLSESFAAYFEYHITANLWPSWRLKEQFLVNVVHKALKYEETSGAYPLDYPIEYDNEFPPNHIMYGKGSSIIRMMEHFLTPEIFRKGVNKYLCKNKFKAALPFDLYDAFQIVVDKYEANHLLHNMIVREIMKTWDSTEGFPMVTVKRDYETGSLNIQQKSRFDNTTTWIVPINFVFSSNEPIDFSKTHADYWLTQENATIHNAYPTDGWFLANNQGTGYYRVNYDLENWERIISYLKTDNFSNIHPTNRAQLLNNVFYAASQKRFHGTLP